MSTFRSNDTDIASILKNIENNEVQLPDFQRGWVWDNYRIKALIASISNSYPVGAVMFLEYGGENLRFKHRSIEGVENEVKRAPTNLILDGQQRLTSIYSALYSKKAVETITEKKVGIKRFYYLDMKKCLDIAIDRIDAIVSISEEKILRSNFNKNIELDLSTTEMEFKENMFPLNIVFDNIACSEWRNNYQEYHKYEKKTMELYTLFDTQILRVIQSYKVPIITLEKTTPKEAVCQVFENVNTGGVSLTVFELVTATFAAEDYDLRKDWEKREEQFKNNPILSEVSSNDFLTAITLLVNYKRFYNSNGSISCKRKDVLNISLNQYKENADLLQNAFIEVSKFLQNEYIFSSYNLPYSTQLIPLATIFSLLDKKIYESTTRNKIAQWYWCGVLGEMYGGANETRYALDVIGVINWIEKNEIEPDTISRAYFNPTRLLSLQTRSSAAYKGIMALLLKTGCKDFISGNSINITAFNDDAIDIHHIFPRVYAEKKYPREKWNSIINKAPLSARTNRILGSKSPSSYLKRIEQEDKVSNNNLDEYLKSHLINPFLIREDKFDDYFLERAKMILDLISKSMGKTISNRDSEEIVKLFGGKL